MDKFDTKSREKLIQSILNINASNFDVVALDVFRYQVAHNDLYQKYLSYLGINPSQISDISQIPFLPIAFFKNHSIKSGDWEAELLFRSSGTTGSVRSSHALRSKSFYQKVAQIGFEKQYGSLSNYCILALLPSYLEREDSSLVCMVEHFMHCSKHPQNGFYLKDFAALSQQLKTCQANQTPCLLIGVSFALLDFAADFPMPLTNTIMMETGGMKGRKKEITRKELHTILQKAFGLEHIHSEYGMTELLSQGYSKGDGIFRTIPSMKVLIRELNDPFCLQKTGKSGGVCIIDLANLDTCSFIATEDIGRVYSDGTFEILGRIDYSALRGCNLMVSDL